MVELVFFRDYEVKKCKVYPYKDGLYNSDIIALDTETTTLFEVNGEWIAQSDMHDYEVFSDAKKHALVYIWIVAINDAVIYGREMRDFFIFWRRYISVNPYKSIIYVHNLGYDFTFFQEFMPDDTVAFARAPYRPIYVRSEELKAEFRCSYFLTNMSLETCAKEFRLSVQKAAGWLNYHKSRTPMTELTEKELIYCEYDVRVLVALIREVFLPRYGTIANIPITQTGEVRRQVRALLNVPDYLKTMRMIKPDFEVYVRLSRLLAGGYTHLNYLYEGEEVFDLDCYDFSSSYPFEMCTNKFPMGRFRRCNEYIENDDEYSYFFLFKADGLKSLSAWSYVSKSKVEKAKGAVIDNGKISECSDFEMWCTDCDYQIIKENYEVINPQITNIYRAYKTYLPRDLIDFILTAYEGKTKLKGVDDMYSLYMRHKQLINSVFGMTITALIRDDVVFSVKNGVVEWGVSELSDEDISSKLNAHRPFLNYAWGVWVTAYSRQRLWSIINQVGNDGVYSDTDSLKMVNGICYNEVIENYNRSVDERIKRVCDALDLDIMKFYPSDSKGDVHALGYFEFDGHYKRFKSFGAKKYCYEDEKGFHFVVAGLQKRYTDDDGEHLTMKCFDEFRLGYSVKYGRNIMSYLDNLQPIEVVDYRGNKYVTSNKMGVALMRGNYTFGISEDYAAFVENYQGLIMDTRNKYSNPFRHKL